MTDQIPDVLHYQGESLCLRNDLLGEYFALANVLVWHHFSDCSGLWRGYRGTWEITDGRLYLLNLVDADGLFGGQSKLSLATYFPDSPERVFAHWVSKKLHATKGERLKYLDGRRGSHEWDICITVENGIVISSEEQDNRNQPDDSITQEILNDLLPSSTQSGELINQEELLIKLAAMERYRNLSNDELRERMVRAITIRDLMDKAKLRSNEKTPDR